jgi:O-antigen/teichoic acid export membrane protein
VSIIKKLAKDTVAYGLSSILARLINYIFGFIIVLYITPAEYGIYAKFYAYAGFILVVLTHGMETTFFRYYSMEDKPSEVFGTTFASIGIASVIFGLFCYALKAPISYWVQEPEEIGYVLFFAGILIFDALSALPFAYLRATHQPYRFALLKILAILLMLVITMTLLYLVTNENYYDGILGYIANHRVSTIFIGNLMSSAIIVLTFLPLVMRTIAKPSFKLYKKMLPYALPIMVVGFAGMINEMLDRILLERLLPYSPIENKTQLGIYSFNYKLAMMMTLFIQAYRYAAEPYFFAQAKHKDAQQVYAKTMHYFIGAGMLIFTVISCATPLIYKILLQVNPNKFAPYASGWRVVPILLAANLCLGIYFNISTWYKITDRTYFGAIIALLGACITIFLNYGLVPTMGYLGSAWATLLCYLIMVILGYTLEKKYYPIPYPLRKIAQIICMALAITIGYLYLLQIKDLSLSMIFLSVVGIILIFFMYLYLHFKNVAFINRKISD